jgi:hypothetical protein
MGALRTQLQPGTIISLQRGSKKRSSESNGFESSLPMNCQAGIESVEPQNNFWGVNLSDRELEAKKRCRHS